MKKITITLEIDTEKDIDEIRTSLTKGIYRGLDTPPTYIAPPANVKINSIELAEEEQTMKCGSCEAEIEDGVLYCPNCGDETF